MFGEKSAVAEFYTYKVENEIALLKLLDENYKTISVLPHLVVFGYHLLHHLQEQAQNILP